MILYKNIKKFSFVQVQIIKPRMLLFLLINVKMPTMKFFLLLNVKIHLGAEKSFMLICVEQEIFFITSGLEYVCFGVEIKSD